MTSEICPVEKRHVVVLTKRTTIREENNFESHAVRRWRRLSATPHTRQDVGEWCVAVCGVRTEPGSIPRTNDTFKVVFAQRRVHRVQIQVWAKTVALELETSSGALDIRVDLVVFVKIA